MLRNAFPSHLLQKVIQKFLYLQKQLRFDHTVLENGENAIFIKTLKTFIQI